MANGKGFGRGPDGIIDVLIGFGLLLVFGYGVVVPLITVVLKT